MACDIPNIYQFIFHLVYRKYNCRSKPNCPLNGECLVQCLVHKTTSKTSNNSFVYYGTSEGHFKTRYNNHTKSFRHREFMNETDNRRLSSASDKAKLFAKNFSKNSNLDESGISLPVFPSRTNLKLHNISITPKMVKKVITNLDSSKASGPDCIPVVVLKNCEPELSYILTKLFNKCLKESCFPDCWKVSSVVPVFKNVGKRSTAKNYRPVSLLSVVSKVFEKLVNNRIVDHLEKCGLFLISSMVLGLLDQLQIF